MKLKSLKGLPRAYKTLIVFFQEENHDLNIIACCLFFSHTILMIMDLRMCLYIRKMIYILVCVCYYSLMGYTTHTMDFEYQ